MNGSVILYDIGSLYDIDVGISKFIEAYDGGEPNRASGGYICILGSIVIGSMGFGGSITMGFGGSTTIVVIGVGFTYVDENTITMNKMTSRTLVITSSLFFRLLSCVYIMHSHMILD